MSSLSGRDTGGGGAGTGKDGPALVLTADAAARSDPMKHLQGCMARIA